MFKIYFVKFCDFNMIALLLKYIMSTFQKGITKNIFFESNRFSKSLGIYL